MLGWPLTKMYSFSRWSLFPNADLLLGPIQSLVYEREISFYMSETCVKSDKSKMISNTKLYISYIHKVSLFLFYLKAHLSFSSGVPADVTSMARRNSLKSM